MPKYIDADELLENINDAFKAVKEIYGIEVTYTLSEMIKIFREIITDEPPADVVEYKYFDIVLKRLKHLLQSKYIASFDKVKIGTGKYIRDIKEADNEQKVKHGEWLEDGAMYKCSNCGNLESYYTDTYCRSCGAKMDGEEN